MKLKLDEFKQAFDVCDYVQPSPVADSSQFTRLKREETKLTLSLTGMLYAEASVKVSEPGKWTAFIDRRALKAFLSTSKSPDIEFFYKDKLILKTDQRLEVAPHNQITGYETWTPKSLFDLEPDQSKILKTSLRYLPHMAGTDHVNAMAFVKDYGVIVTDTLFMMAVLGSQIKTSFFIPGAIVSVLSSNSGKIAADKTGSGISLNNGFVYQPLSSDLDRYPVDKCKSTIDEAFQAQSVLKAKASDLVEVLRAASSFLLDKAESAEMSPTKSGLLLTVNMHSGKFQRIIPLVGECKLKQTVQWSLRRLLPWLEYAVSVKDDIELDYVKLASASAFKFKDAVLVNILLMADI